MTSPDAQRIRILVPLLYEYYLFDYFKKLIPRFLADGAQVTLLTLDQSVLDSYQNIEHPCFRLRLGPRWLRALHHSNLVARAFLWIAGRMWTRSVSRDQDFVVVPWANKPIWYLFTRRLPSLACETTTVFMDIEDEVEYTKISSARMATRGFRLSIRLDRLLGGRYLPRVGDVVMNHKPGFHFVDKLFGYRPLNYFSAFTGLTYLTVPGERYADNYRSLGVTQTAFPVTGSPSYEDVFAISSAFDEIARRSFLNDLLGSQSARGPICSFFLSPSHFSEQQIEEVAIMVEAARRWNEQAICVLKFHPKTEAQEPERFRKRLSALGDDLVIITSFTGDDYNTRLILVSDVVLQKQGTVGFIAMLLKRPMISYNVVDTGYLDDTYKKLEASLHVERRVELASTFAKLDDESEMETLRRMQEVACRLYCLDVPSPCALVSAVIQGHFGASEYSDD